MYWNPHWENRVLIRIKVSPNRDIIVDVAQGYPNQGLHVLESSLGEKGFNQDKGISQSG